ncbi:hypothetical protein Psi02_24880 [Planotetraspora silvatica]|uniref:Uncharacterized protein n=1 Tax=Planotetraspora silvatica TaxID=234614 RepID=A0A8J3UPM1_9ACTN|nr:hypothetical protein [Planotetraspora silvatica]GII46064.1 hypothetical protein Psi02_24880 [Planotetraspora silvatica]
MTINEVPETRPDPGAVRRRWLWFTGPATFAAVLTLLAFVPPDGYLLGVLAAFGAWLFAGVWWLILLVGPATRAARLNAWPPVIGALTAALVIIGVPARAALLISEPALLEYAESLPNEDYISVDRFAGVLPISGVQRSGSAVIFAVDGAGGMLTQCGFAYAPGGRVKDLPVSTADHLMGDWYATCTDFD